MDKATKVTYEIKDGESNESKGLDFCYTNCGNLEDIIDHINNYLKPIGCVCNIRYTEEVKGHVIEVKEVRLP